MNDILMWSYAVLSTSPVRWFNLVETIPNELLFIHPKAGEWSAAECLLHMATVERLSTHIRIHAFLAGEPFPGFTPAEPPSNINVAELAQEFATLREESLGLIKQMTPADLERQALHGEYGTVSLSHFLHHLAAHDLMHLVQAEQAMMQPLIQNCGPWVVNYNAHIAK